MSNPLSTPVAAVHRTLVTVPGKCQYLSTEKLYHILVESDHDTILSSKGGVVCPLTVCPLSTHKSELDRGYMP
eukprot:15356399-Ditylum_brightwellii.AAC.1